MNKSAITLICSMAISFAFSSCNLFGSGELPVMDSRVVSYQMIYPSEGYDEYLGYGSGFVTEQDTLKSWFPNIFNNEQAEAKCNYFAIYFSTSSSLKKYWILSKDMILYQIKPGYGYEECFVTADIVYYVMLVCDDTEERNLKDKIDIDHIRFFTDENWDCRENREDVFF